MGGNAIKDARRLNVEEYNQMLAEVLPLVGKIHDRFEVVTAYRNKDSFGDMDIVVAKPKLDRQVFEEWLETIGSQEVAYNNDYISFEYKGFQIDLIYVPEEDFETAIFYYSYNDLNNLVGRVAHKFGVKFGWDGLTYQVRTESGHEAKKIVLSKDPREIYQFLGYDYDRYLEGFDTLEDIFNYVIGSPYFSPRIYQYDNLNHTNRTRNAKRKTYASFLLWLEQAEGLGSYVFSEDKSPYLIKIHNAFRKVNLFYQLTTFAEAVMDQELRARKFNGRLIQEWIPGLQGPALGKAIASFKKHIEARDGNDFDKYVDRHNAQTVRQNFLEYMETLYGAT